MIAALTGLLGVTLLTGNLIGISLILFGLAIIEFQFGGNYVVLGSGLWNIFNSFALTALPIFIFLGEIMVQTGVSQRIYAAISPLLNRLPGHLVQTNIGACTLFSAICGSSQATAAVVGSISYKEMEKRGYDRQQVAGSIAAGGTLGILIPPSLPLIIYGWWQEVSIGKLFLAGIIPGLILASMFMLYIGLRAKRHPHEFPADAEQMPLWQALKASIAVWPFFILVFAILGTLVLGLATPTESAALGVAAALGLALLYRQLSVSVVWRALMATVAIFSTISLIIIGATVLSQALALSGIPKDLAQMVSESGISRFWVLMSVFALYIVLGCFLAAIEMLLITLPFTFPLIVGLGYDPVWFGIALVLLIEVGLLTPPVGMNLFIMLAICGGTLSLGEIARACVPYWLIVLLLLGAMTTFPEIALFLPNLLVS